MKSTTFLPTILLLVSDPGKFAELSQKTENNAIFVEQNYLLQYLARRIQDLIEFGPRCSPISHSASWLSQHHHHHRSRLSRSAGLAARPTSRFSGQHKTSRRSRTLLHRSLAMREAAGGSSARGERDACCSAGGGSGGHQAAREVPRTSAGFCASEVRATPFNESEIVRTTPALSEA